MMKKWFLRLLYAALVLLPVGAIADYTATTGTGSTVFAFVCFTTKICPAQVLMNSAGTEIATSGNPVRTDPTGTTTQPVSVAALPLPSGAGTSANQATIITALGTLNTTAGNPVTLGSATGGWTKSIFAALSTTVQTVKGTAGQLGKLYCDNPNATAIYVETFDVASATTVTLGTTAPTQAYYVPATNAAGFSLPLVGDQYTLGIKIAAVTTYNGSTAPATPGNCNVSWN